MLYQKYLYENYILECQRIKKCYKTRLHRWNNEKYNPDIICCSETKLSSNIEIINNNPYKYINYSKVIYGYAGTAIFSKIKPKSKFDWTEQLDKEGRLISLEFNDCIIANIYAPNAGEKLQNLHWKIYTWFPNLIEIIHKLQQKKPVIICGEL